MKPLIDHLLEEGWAWVHGYEGKYKVHKTGTVSSVDRYEEMSGRHPSTYFRLRKGTVIKPVISNAGYLQVGLYKGGSCKRYTVHRVVATAFLPNPENLPEVNHIDECKTNNNLWNLQWCSRAENAKHSSYKYRGDKSAKAKLTEREVLQIRDFLLKGVCQTKLGRLYGVSNHVIHKIKCGHNWAWLTGLDKEGKL